MPAYGHPSRGGGGSGDTLTPSDKVSATGRIRSGLGPVIGDAATASPAGMATQDKPAQQAGDAPPGIWPDAWPGP